MYLAEGRGVLELIKKHWAEGPVSVEFSCGKVGENQHLHVYVVIQMKWNSEVGALESDWEGFKQRRQPTLVAPRMKAAMARQNAKEQLHIGGSSGCDLARTSKDGRPAASSPPPPQSLSQLSGVQDPRHSAHERSNPMNNTPTTSLRLQRLQHQLQLGKDSSRLHIFQTLSTDLHPVL
jgi:hypothetical protein